MQLNFILIFALITTTLTTIIFALSSVIGENIVKHQVGYFFEKELIKDYEIDNFHFDGLHISFNIDIENREVAKVVGSISLKDFLINLDFKMVDIESKWIKKFKDIGRFSSNGKVKITLFGSRIDSIVVTDQETIKFRYRKKFMTKTRYLDIQKSSISIKTFNKLTGLHLVGNRIKIDGELIGDSQNMIGDLNISLDNINIVGELEYEKGLILFNGYSEELEGEVYMNITDAEQQLSFNNVMIEKLLELFYIKNKLYGKGDLFLDYSNSSINFRGDFNKISFDENYILEYLGDILHLDINTNMFKKVIFEGETESDEVVFNLTALNNLVEIKINNGIYYRGNRKLDFNSKLSIDIDDIARVQYRTGSSINIDLYGLGEDNFKKFIDDSFQDRSYQQDVKDLLELYY